MSSSKVSSLISCLGKAVSSRCHQLQFWEIFNSQLWGFLYVRHVNPRVCSHFCAIITISRSFSPSQSKRLHPLKNNTPIVTPPPAILQPQATTIQLAMILGISYEWNHTVFVFSHLVSLSMMSSRFINAEACVRISF